VAAIPARVRAITGSSLYAASTTVTDGVASCRRRRPRRRCATTASTMYQPETTTRAPRPNQYSQPTSTPGSTRAALATVQVARSGQSGRTVMVTGRYRSGTSSSTDPNV
jgi:hypothetical protein